jgi:hypothetical protein
MNARDRLDAISKLWDELGITELLEEHIPLPQRYLVDHLLRYLNSSESVEDD